MAVGTITAIYEIALMIVYYWALIGKHFRLHWRNWNNKRTARNVNGRRSYYKPKYKASVQGLFYFQGKGLVLCKANDFYACSRNQAKPITCLTAYRVQDLKLGYCYNKHCRSMKDKLEPIQRLSYFKTLFLPIKKNCKRFFFSTFSIKMSNIVLGTIKRSSSGMLPL